MSKWCWCPFTGLLKLCKNAWFAVAVEARTSEAFEFRWILVWTVQKWLRVWTSFWNAGQPQPRLTCIPKSGARPEPGLHYYRLKEPILQLLWAYAVTHCKWHLRLWRQKFLSGFAEGWALWVSSASSLSLFCVIFDKLYGVLQLQ